MFYQFTVEIRNISGDRGQVAQKKYLENWGRLVNLLYIHVQQVGKKLMQVQWFNSSLTEKNVSALFRSRS